MTYHDFAPQHLPENVTPAASPGTADASRDEIPPDPPYSRPPSLRRLLIAFFVHHNPFYLLSALCMIAGCYTLNAGLELRTGEIQRILILIVTLAVYELLLLILGLFLIRSRGILRDGRTLLLLQLVFLVDLTFLNAETATIDLRSGLFLNGVLWLMALGKVGLALKVLSPRFPWRAYLMAGLMLTALFALPGVLKAVSDDGWIAGLHFHAMWWGVGLLPVACEMIRHVGRRQADNPADQMRPRLAGLYVAIGFMSVVAHLSLMHWVYRGRFYSADLTPVLLGLAVAAAYGSPNRVIRGGDLRLARFWLPVAAVLCAVAGPRPLDLAIGLGGRFELTSLHLAMLGAAALYTYAYFWRWARTIAVTTAAIAALALFGPTLRQILSSLQVAWDDAIAFVWQLMPKTMVQWGMTAIGASFAFLGLGALLSLSQPKQATKADEAPPSGGA